MPGGDRTGPEGYGSRTGRGLGYCTGYNSPGFTQQFQMGRGFGRFRGRGLGRGNWRGRRGFWFNEYKPRNNFLDVPMDDEKKYLENTLEGLNEEIKDIEKRLKDLSEK